MKNKYSAFINNALLRTVFVLLVFVTATAQAQTPQYYNNNTSGTGGNSYPLNQAAGQRVQLLYRHGDFNNPTPVTPGYITSISIRVEDGNPVGHWTYHDFSISLGQTTDSDLPTTDFYTGTLYNAYFRDSVILDAAGGTWLTIPLDIPFKYDTAQNLIVEVAHSSIDGSVAGYSWAKSPGTGVTRLWSSPGLPLVFGGSDASCYHLGINVTNNDSCMRAVNVLPGTIVYGSTVGSGVQDVPTCYTSLNTAPGVWFKFTATDTYTNVNTCTGTSYDSKLGIYIGDCDSLICIAGNDDGCGLRSNISFCSQPGMEYFVYVTGYSTGAGTFELEVNCSASSAPYFYVYPANITQASDPGGNCGANIIMPVFVYGWDFDDDCGATITNDYTGTDDASGFYPVGTTYVNWTLIDADSNTTTYQDTIIVLDTQAPVLHCPADIVQSNDPGVCQAVVNYTPPVGIEDCPTTISPIDLYHSNTQNIIQGIACASMSDVKHNRLAVVFDLPSLGALGGLYIDTVDFAVYTASSTSGYQPAKINLYSLAGPLDTLNMTLIDSMSIQIPDCSDTILSYPFSTFIPAGTVLVYEIDIPDGTAAVNYMRLGTNLDGQSTPSYILAEECGVYNFLDLSTVCCTDAYVMNIHGTTGGGTALISGIGSGGIFPIGTTTEVYKSSDAAGNYSICTMNVTVEDTEAPMLTAPADITLNQNSCTVHNVGCTIQNGFAGAFDPYYWNFYQINADGYGDLSLAPDTIVMVGGNNLSDNEGFTNAAVAINCNGDVVFSWEYNGGDSAVYDAPQYSLDGGITYTQLPGFSISGPVSQSGTATIPVQNGQIFVLSVYTLDNMYGAASLKIFDFSGPATPLPIFSDNCGIQSVSSNHPSSEYEAGVNTVTWTATDIHGNVTSVDQIITITESIDPVVNCPSDIEITTTSSVGEVYLYNVTATDNCAVTDLVQTAGLASGSQFPIGVTTNTWTATDASGNTGTCTFTVTVTDVTSLGESGESAVNVYPNPASDVVYAELPEGFEGTLVSLYNAEGALVRSYGACNEKLAEFDIKGLTEGVYFMKFENQHTIFFKKVVKN